MQPRLAYNTCYVGQLALERRGQLDYWMTPGLHVFPCPSSNFYHPLAMYFLVLVENFYHPLVVSLLDNDQYLFEIYAVGGPPKSITFSPKTDFSV